MSTSSLAGAAFLAVVLLLSATPARVPSFDGADWAAVAFIAVSGGSLGYRLFLWALKHTTPTRVEILMPLSPISAACVAAVALGEPIGAGLVAGPALVTAGIVLVNWSALRRVSEAAPRASSRGPA